MDRRTKLILLIIASFLLLGAVFLFIVWPLLRPVLPNLSLKAQPPSVTSPNAPNINVPSTPGQNGGTSSPSQLQPFTYSPEDINPDMQRIIELSRRAGVLSERIESGSNENQFKNMEDAMLDASPALIGQFRQKQKELQERYPAVGPAYITIARRLVEIPESELVIERDDFVVRVQLQIQITEGDQRRTEYRETTVTFRRNGSVWDADGYSVQPFTP